MKREVKHVVNPLVIMFEAPGGKIQTHIHPPVDFHHGHYALLACDLIRNVANAFQVPVGEVWAIVDKERSKPTTNVKMIKMHGESVQ